MTHSHQAYLLHAISPLHVGVGQAAGAIDLPIARLKGTHIPYIPGSGIKGVLRDALDGHPAHADIFGPKTDNASEHAGALITADARLLLLPVRSLRGAFAWVTSPLLLSLAARDLQLAGFKNIPHPAPSFHGRGAQVAAGSRVTHKPNGQRERVTHKPNGQGERVFLEDLSLQVQGTHGDAATAWGDLLTKTLGFDGPELTERLVIVDDDTMSFLWDTATQIDQRVSIDHETGTAKDGALWSEESLPAETVLISVLSATHTRRKGSELEAQKITDAVLNHAKQAGALQFGGKATVGRGRCIIKPFQA
jgi:CRISPR-associated protein Cmr4